MYFEKYRLQKMCLDKCPKNPESEESSTSNIGNGPKRT